MIISAFECECGMYNTQLKSNLKAGQLGQDNKKRDLPFEITELKRECTAHDCTVVTTVGVLKK